MALLKFLETIRSPFLDVIIETITRFGEETIIMLVICAIYWCINKKVAYIIGIAFFFSGLTVQGMKICFRIDRPWVIDTTLSPIPAAMKQATGYSFPSGHTQSAASFYGSLGAVFKRKSLKAACIAIVILVAFPRLYLGVHTLVDVAVSIIISFLLIFITTKILSDSQLNRKKEFLIALVMVLYSIAAIVVAMILYSSGKIEQTYVSDCLKAAGAGVGFSIGMYIERVYIDFPTAAKTVLMQILKLLLGLAGIIVIKEGIKLVMGIGLVIDTIRYFMMPIWLTVAYPLIIKRFFRLQNVG